MTPRAKCLFGSLLLVLATARADLLYAQFGATQPKPSPVEASGTVEAVAPMMVKLTTSANQTWVFRLNPKAEIHVTGTAEADFLRPGLFVEFTADLDRKGNAANKVSELAIFTPTMQKFPGLFPVGGAFGEKPEPGAKRDPNATTSYKVLGRITTIKKEDITVHTGRGMVKFELGDSPKITVDIADFSVVQQGDKIKLRGSSAQEGFGEASEVNVEMSQPLSGAKKKPGHKPDEKPDGPGDKPDKKEPKRPKKDRPVKEPKEPKEEPKEEKAKENASAAPDRIRQIVTVLELGPDEAKGRRPAKIAVGPDSSEVFAPARPEPLSRIEALLGKPRAARTIEGMMATGEGQKVAFVSLRLLDCDGVKVFVDDQGVVRFYQVAP